MNAKPGGNISPFCEPVTRTSSSQRSNSNGFAVIPDTASTTSSAGCPRICSRMASMSWRTPVEVSLCVASTALVSGLPSSALAISPGSTAYPHSTSNDATSTPCASQISAHRSPNLPPRITRARSPLDSVLTTAASIAPVPDAVSVNTSFSVRKRYLRPSFTSTNSSSNSGAR